MGGVCFGAGLGITIFGIMYMFIHDGMVHRRFPVSSSTLSQELQFSNLPFLLILNLLVCIGMCTCPSWGSRVKSFTVEAQLSEGWRFRWDQLQTSHTSNAVQ